MVGRSAGRVLVSGLVVFLTALTGCEKQTPPPRKDAAPANAPAPPPTAATSPAAPVQPVSPPHAPARPVDLSPELADTIDRLVKALVAASPMAGGADVQARDAAAEKLSHIGVLLDAGDELVLWGRFDEKVGYDPALNQVIGLAPEVLARLYLSCFMFGGTHEVRMEGAFTVVEVAAALRAGLPLGDYPHPFWYDPAEWLGYLDTESVVLVFDDSEMLVAGYFKAGKQKKEGDRDREWDQRWVWADANGVEQPRVSRFEYLLSPDNPDTKALDAAYRGLAAHFESQGCLECHSPANAAGADVVFLLGYPNQALAARAQLVEVLRDNSMPPGDSANGVARGIRNEAVRAAMLAAAEKFLEQGDSALTYEGTQTIRPEEYPVPAKDMPRREGLR